MSFQNGAISGQVCDSCGYALDGLPIGTKCPECGESSAPKGKSIHEATMSFQAPAGYIKMVRYGFLLCMVAIMGGMLGPIIIGITAGTKSMLLPLAMVLFVLASWCWTAGVWIITKPRLGIGTVTKDDILDNATFVRIIRIMSVAWPCWILLIASGIIMRGGGGAPMFYSVLASIVGLVAWVGLIPACIYFAEMAFWASDEWLSNRLRGTAWFMTVFGVLAVISKLLSVTSLPISSPAKIVHIWTYVISFLATAMLFYSIFRMSILLNWVLSHKHKNADKHKRLAERIENQMNRSGLISNKTLCDYCFYDLNGLPFKGNCPECGERYGEFTEFPIRDPALDKPKHDETPINLEQSTGGIVHQPRSLGDPLEDIKDTGDHHIDDGGTIPLADESDDEPNEPNAS